MSEVSLEEVVVTNEGSSETSAEVPTTEEPTIEVYVQDAKFFEDHVEVTMDNGLVRNLSLHSFVEAMSQVVGRLATEAKEKFVLPEGCFYLNRSASGIQLSCYYPSTKRMMMYLDTKFEIVTPNIIISHRLTRQAGKSDYTIENSHYLCTDLPVGRLPTDFIWSPNHEQRIFLLPMSNTYSEGHMCFGHNQMIHNFVDGNLRPLNWYHDFLWSSPFNNDLGIRASAGDIHPRDWYALLRQKAKDNEAFPYESLRGYTPR